MRNMANRIRRSLTSYIGHPLTEEGKRVICQNFLDIFENFMHRQPDEIENLKCDESGRVSFTIRPKYSVLKCLQNPYN